MTLALLGYDPRKVHSGPAPFEAVGQGIAVDEQDVVFRCSMVTLRAGTPGTGTNLDVKKLGPSDDVIHSFAVPAFWIKQDANPGQLHEAWAKVDRPGVYFGQCSELCGARHAFMPIAIEVVPPAQFAQWVASKGGTMPGTKKPAPDSTGISPVTPAAVPAQANPQPPQPASGNAVQQPATNQAATAQN